MGTVCRAAMTGHSPLCRILTALMVLLLLGQAMSTELGQQPNIVVTGSRLVGGPVEEIKVTPYSQQKANFWHNAPFMKFAGKRSSVPALSQLVPRADPCDIMRYTLLELFEIVQEEVANFQTCLQETGQTVPVE